MGPMVDSIKLVAGRRAVTATSATRLRDADTTLLVGAARAIVANGEAEAGMGLPLPTGGHAVLRRIGGTDEVRGVLLPEPSDREAILHLLANARFWSNTAFTLARRVPIDLRRGQARAPESWTYLFRTSPAGFTPIDEPDSSAPMARPTAPASPDGARTDRIARPAQQRFPDHGAEALPEPEPDPYPRWTVVACGLLTMSAMLFLGIATVLSRPGPPAAAPISIPIRPPSP